MKMDHRRWGAAALALVVCLSASPVATASGFRDGDLDFGQRIVRVIKKIRKILPITAQDDLPSPPLPKP